MDDALSEDDTFQIDMSQSGSFDHYSTGSYHHYTNDYLEYAFAMPNYSYYQGQGAQNGANHTMAIATTASGIEIFEQAPVQVYFYKTTPADAPSTLYTTVSSGILYVKTYGELSDREKRIVETILQSAH